MGSPVSGGAVALGLPPATGRQLEFELEDSAYWMACLRRFRESAGLTQEALARAADVGRVTLVRLENGEQSPRFKTLKRVADALGMETLDLLV